MSDLSPLSGAKRKSALEFIAVAGKRLFLQVLVSQPVRDGFRKRFCIVGKKVAPGI